jgi:hypothetical protein
VRLSPARRFVVEVLHHARRVPSLPDHRPCDVAEALAARRAARPAPSWTAIFMKAYGLVSLEHPELRRAYVPLPYPHLYEHPSSECGFLVEREWQGEQVVLGAKVRRPEDKPLAAIDAYLRHLKAAPVPSVNYFRKVLRVGRMPWPLRRLTLFHSLYLSGYRRAKRLGTFTMSSLGSLGAHQGHPLTPLTTYFTFGPVSPAGAVELRVVYDHRVLDARCAARVLAAVERTVNTRLADEMRSLGRSAAGCRVAGSAPFPARGHAG